MAATLKIKSTDLRVCEKDRVGDGIDGQIPLVSYVLVQLG